jgi:hypothetical protein
MRLPPQRRDGIAPHWSVTPADALRLPPGCGRPRTSTASEPGHCALRQFLPPAGLHQILLLPAGGEGATAIELLAHQVEAEDAGLKLLREALEERRLAGVLKEDMAVRFREFRRLATLSILIGIGASEVALQRSDGPGAPFHLLRC